MNANGQFRDSEVVVRRTQVNGEWIETPYVKIGGKLRVLHEQNERVNIGTEIIKLEPDYVVMRASVQTSKGTFTGTGVATARMDSRVGDALVSLSETRAVARACRHAGYAMDTCSAEEIANFPDEQAASTQPSNKPPEPVFPEGNGRGDQEAKPQHCGNSGGERETYPPNGGNGRATQAQVRALYALSKRTNMTEETVKRILSTANAAAFEDLSIADAGRMIQHLQSRIPAA
jgi:hypothetical protein